MLVATAFDRHVRTQPSGGGGAAFVKLITRKRLEGLLCDNRVDEEEQPQRYRRCLKEDRMGPGCLLPLFSFFCFASE